VVPANISAWLEQYTSPEFRPFLSPATPPVTVPPEQIALGAEGKLGSDGHRYTVQSSGNVLVITPTAPATSYTGDLPSVTRHRPYITANGNALGENVIFPWANFCVGQKITFSEGFQPPLPNGTQFGPFMWEFTGEYVNDGTNVVPGGTFPNSSTNYFVNQGRLGDQTTSAWWVEGEFSPPKDETATLGEWLTFPNGQYVAVFSHGKFTMYQPEVTSAPEVVTPAISTNGTWAAAFGMGLQMIWSLYVNLNTNFPGILGYVQLINVDNSWDVQPAPGTITNVNTAGQFWLDNTFPYQAGGSGPFTNWAPHIVSQTNMTFGDLPTLVALFPYSFASASYRFKTYPYFLHQSAGSIEVALGRATWGWDGKLVFTNAAIALTVSNVVPVNFVTQSGLLPNWTNTYHNY
jgi:hypothetical protein